MVKFITWLSPRGRPNGIRIHVQPNTFGPGWITVFLQIGQHRVDLFRSTRRASRTRIKSYISHPNIILFCKLQGSTHFCWRFVWGERSKNHKIRRCNFLQTVKNGFIFQTGGVPSIIASLRSNCGTIEWNQGEKSRNKHHWSDFVRWRRTSAFSQASRQHRQVPVTFTDRSIGRYNTDKRPRKQISDFYSN